jgi:rubrerythrin
MDFNSIEDILDFAIASEIEAAEFYEGISEQEEFRDKKDMMRDFAAEERKHQKLLEDVKAGSLGTQLDDYDFKWISDLKRSNYVADIEYHPGMGYSDLLLLAMKREEKALQLYNDMLPKARNEEQTKVFKMLCQEEAKHKLALETMFDDYMAEMGD